MNWLYRKINWLNVKINWPNKKINWPVSRLNILNTLNRINELYLIAPRGFDLGNDLYGRKII